MSSPFEMFFNRGPRRPRGKQTVITTTTERRTPDGLLLSTSHSRNIFYGEQYPGMQHVQHDVVTTSPEMRRRRMETPIFVDRGHSPRPRSQTIIREERYRRRDEWSPEPRSVSVLRTPEVRHVSISRHSDHSPEEEVRRVETRTAFREDTNFDRWRDERRPMRRAGRDGGREPEEEHVYIDPGQLYSNSTIYGDDWSARGSVCKQSHLVRQTDGLSTELVLVLNRLNDLRIAKGLRPLVVDCALMREAEVLIKEMCRDGRMYSTNPNRRLSLWKGDRLHSAIADLWTNHGPSSHANHRFDPTGDESLCVAGLASGYAHDEQKFVVVALFD